MNKRIALYVALLLLPILVFAGSNVPALQEAASQVALPLPKALAAPAALSSNDVIAALEETLGQIYEDVSPSVVNIQVTGGAVSLAFDDLEIPGFPSDPSMPMEPFQQQGLGSGFVWDKEGHIVTNNHVVAGAEEITVTFYDGTTVRGKVIGTDPHSDLAVLNVEVPAVQLHPVELADSTQVRVGELTVAIGNPFGLEGTMTVGFISALGRSLPVSTGNMLAPSYTIPDILQTDAPINPGNSGGVLVEDGGQVIGVPTAIESPVGANAGIGFAIPSAIVERVIPALIENGAYEHPWLGISGVSMNLDLAEAMELEPNQRGVLVIEVVPGGPAEEAGLQGSDRPAEINGREVQVGGDLIVGIDSQRVNEFDDLVTYLVRSTSVGESVTMTLLRDGQEESVQVTLAARPIAEEEEPLRSHQTPPQAPQRRATGGGWLGIMGLTVTPEIAEAMDLATGQDGVLVQEVIRDTPADEAGLLGGDQVVDIDGQQVSIGGDIIVAVDGESAAGMEELRATLQQAGPGQEVTLTILRAGDEIEITVTLGERPASTP